MVIHLELLAHRFEGALKLVFLEQYLRDSSLANKAMEEARYIYCLFIRFLARLIVRSLSPAAATVHSLRPQLLWMLEEEHWYRALMQESLTALAIMTVDTEDSRSVRRPWGLLKLQQLSPNAKRNAIHTGCSYGFQFSVESTSCVISK